MRNAKFVNATTLPVITFMANCVCDLYSLDPVSAYQHGFLYIRQLAIHLRNALNTHTKVRFICRQSAIEVGRSFLFGGWGRNQPKDDTA